MTSVHNDDPLWLRLRAGDRSVLDDLYRRQAPHLRRYFLARLPDRDEADDCVQEVFLRAAAVASAQAPEPVRAIGPWLWGIAKNVGRTRIGAELRVRDQVHTQPVDELAAGAVLRAAAYHQDFASDEDGKRRALLDAPEVIATLSPRRQELFAAFLTATRREGREVKGAELAAELGEGWTRELVDRELSRARADVRRGMAILAVAREAPGCPTAAGLVRDPGPRLRFGELTTAERAALATHASDPVTRVSDAGDTPGRRTAPQKVDCKRCRLIFRDAQRSGLYVFGPGLLLLAGQGNADDDERRRAALAAEPDQPDPPAGPGSPATLPRGLGQRALSRLQSALHGAVGRVAAVPAVNDVVQVVQGNPAVFRLVGVATVLFLAAGAGLAASSPGSPRPIASASAPVPPVPSSRVPTPTPTSGSVSPSAPPGSATPTQTGSGGGPDGGASSGSDPGGGGSGGSGSGGSGSGGSGSGGSGSGGSGSDGNGSDGSGGGGQPAAAPATWGFALVRWVDDPVGSTHDLAASAAHPDNNEANWTYGPWRLDHPTDPPKARATHLATGRQLVVLPGVGSPGGIAHVAAYDYTASGASCQPVGWRAQGADEAVEVACFGRTGQPSDVPVAVLFLAGTVDQGWSLGGARGFVYASDPTAATYLPGAPDARNTGRITRTGTGRYAVVLGGGAEAVQVSPVAGSARYCALTGHTGAVATVACTAHNGVPADTAFTLSYTGRSSLLDDRRTPHAAFLTVSGGSATVPTWWLSKPGSPSVTRTGTGRYVVHMPLGYLPSYTHVVAHGTGYCSLVQRNDYSYKDNASFYVECLTATGTAVDNDFGITYMTASPYE
jgi:DNA-directed RNA polymerase specialized sigma24 family protein